jgi:predicted ATPase
MAPTEFCKTPGCPHHAAFFGHWDDKLAPCMLVLIRILRRCKRLKKAAKVGKLRPLNQAYKIKGSDTVGSPFFSIRIDICETEHQRNQTCLVISMPHNRDACRIMASPGLNQTMMKTLHKLKIEGFKSIERAELALGDMNVVIGANGSGKSNLISVFRLLEQVLARNLQLFVRSEPDRLLHHGRKVSAALALHFEFSDNTYGFKLQAAHDSLIFESEYVETIANRNDRQFKNEEMIAVGHKESQLQSQTMHGRQFPETVFSAIQNLRIYHFHDTSDTSPAKQSCDIDDNRQLRRDAANLPAYLYWLQEKHPVPFRQIEEHIRLVAPFFDRFELAPSKLNDKKIKLEWRQKGSDAYFDADTLSDGTLRFICLATLLLQPTPPALILLDEPELGLHPFAIRILADMLEAAAERVQVLLATQSVTLLNNFAPGDVIVAENAQGKTQFRRLDEGQLQGWLAELFQAELDAPPRELPRISTLFETPSIFEGQGSAE